MDSAPIQADNSAESTNVTGAEPFNEEPFPFMDLPKDIRLMVYERLPRIIKHHTYRHRKSHNLVIIRRSMPVAILTASKAIQSEASAIVLKIAKVFVLAGPLQVVAPLDKGSSSFSRYLKAVSLLVDYAEVKGYSHGWRGFELTKTYDQLVRLVPFELHSVVYHSANRIVLGTSRRITFIFTIPSSFLHLEEHGLNPLLKALLDLSFHAIGHLDPAIIWIFGKLEIESSCAGFSFQEDEDTPLTLGSIPQGPEDFGLSNYTLGLLLPRLLEVSKLVDKDTWVNEWLESSP